MATAMFQERGLRRKIQEDHQKQSHHNHVTNNNNHHHAVQQSQQTNNNNNNNNGKKSAATKRKTAAASAKQSKSEQNNNVKRQRVMSAVDAKDDMLATYQPWVIQTYGDLAKTKTITIKKYARILRTLRGEEVVSADNSKFRFWVKAKGFHVGKPSNYEAKPADAIVGRYSVCDQDEGIPPVDRKLNGSAKDPPLYVPNAPFKNTNGEPVYRKVAVVENFFDIIYNVHVELEGRPGKHAGQKRTYRTITETYAFLPREAVTRFLLGCTECQKHPRSPSPVSVLPTPSPSPTLPLIPNATSTLSTLAAATTTITTTTTTTTTLPSQTNNNHHHTDVHQPEISYLDHHHNHRGKTDDVDRKSPSRGQSLDLSTAKNPDAPQTVTAIDLEEQRDNKEVNKPITTEDRPKRSNNPLDVCNLTSRDPPKTPPKKRHLNHLSDTNNHSKAVHHQLHNHRPQQPIKLWSPVDGIEKEQRQLERNRAVFMPVDIDYSLPITTTYLKYMRSLGCTDEDALKFENRTVSHLIERFLHDIIAHYYY